MFTGCFVPFVLDYSETKNLAIGDAVCSDDISAGGHLWRIECYPHGVTAVQERMYVSLYLRLRSKSNGVKAFFEAFVLNREGKPSEWDTKTNVHEFPCNGDLGWREFVKRVDLEKSCVTASGGVTFICGIGVVVVNPLLVVPPSNIGEHLGHLLDGTQGTDVSFLVGRETFPAHRAVLAARSPVFKAELYGCMSESISSCVTLQDIEPTTFRALLRFIYTDDLPEDTGELDGSPADTFQHLLAVADRYALERLKLMCAQRLLHSMTADSVADILVCAEMYNCPELKNKCIEFFAAESNFKKAAFTDGFAVLLQKFPLIAAELKKRVGI
ncbi:hypothetical protein E2562_001793 [Oryza meyeriana var. granulata]|uniref:BTB domain-containing protein n=1 Tax=Oryza meyeriana var. granulata TaxID=110450 RepID=A0A6G1CBX7_9ORYZ|nr:hypothetical protein E2562_001793 [Oryza meyeriana var. granulata]